MTLTAITTTSITLTQGTVSVTIYIEADSENWTKNLTLITIPKTTGQQDITEGANTTMILDLLLKAEKRYTFTGYLSYSGTTSAQTQKDNLRTLFFAGGTVSMGYEGSTINVSFEKCEVKRLHTGGWQSRENEAEFVVTMTVVRGEDLT
jgi:hypothetical protein